MKRALFIVDTVNGQGHLVRSRALMQELAERGVRCSMVGQPPRSFASCDVAIFDGVAIVDHPTVPTVAIVDTPSFCPSGVDMIVCGSAGANMAMFINKAKVVLAGPEYALLRREFREKHEWQAACVGHMSMRTQQTLDLRKINGLSAPELCSMLHEAWVCSDTIRTFGGMRASEAALVGLSPHGKMEIEPRNDGEELNAAGLIAGLIPDGLGCQRVATAILEVL